MSTKNELKITEHITYTYETTDGEEFKDKDEALQWQEALDHIKDVVMFDRKFRKTTDIEDAYYVRINTDAQVRAFNKMQAELCYVTRIPYIGYFRYDESSEAFIDVKSEINDLQNLVDLLDKEENPQ